MSAATAGLLTSLPVIAFAIFGALAPAAAQRIGIHRVTLVATLAAAPGWPAGRSTRSETLFLALSLLALAGMAMANVLLPSPGQAALPGPDRAGHLALHRGPVDRPDRGARADRADLGRLRQLARRARRLGGAGLLAAIPWVPLAAHDRHLERPARRSRFRDVARTRLGLAMAGFFGLQSLQAYAVFGWFAQLWRDSGYSATTAGLLAGLVAGTSIPLSLLLPNVLARGRGSARG